jgi:hypothetical protein
MDKDISTSGKGGADPHPPADKPTDPPAHLPAGTPKSSTLAQTPETPPVPEIPPVPETGAEDALVFSDVNEADGVDALRRLHPNYKLLMRFAALFVAFVIVIASLVAEAALSDNTDLPFGLVFGPAFLLAAFIAIRVPLSRYNARGYQISRDRLRVVRGVMFRSDTIVPFGRVQHIDVDQGPVERALGIATLTLHTAGNHNSSVHLPGLGHGLAVEMREAIRAHIKRETL